MASFDEYAVHDSLMSAFSSGGVPAGVASSGMGIAGFAKLCGWASVASVYGSLGIIAILALGTAFGRLRTPSAAGRFADWLFRLLMTPLVFWGPLFGLIAVVLGIAGLLFADGADERAEALLGVGLGLLGGLPVLAALLLRDLGLPPVHREKPLRANRPGRSRPVGIPRGDYEIVATDKNHRVRCVALREEAVIDGFVCQAKTEVWFTDRLQVGYVAGSVASFVPAKDVAIDGKRCRAGHKVELQHRDRAKVEVVRFASAETFELGGLELPAGTTVDRAGVIELGQDALLDGIPCRAGAPVELYRDRVRAGRSRPESPFEAGSVLCAGYPHAVGFHADGSIASAVLAEPTEIGGIRYAEFTAIELDREGRMTRAFEPSGR